MLRVSQAIKDEQDKGAQKKGPSEANNTSRQQEQPS
jgi:hypothetical protein